MSGPSFDSFEQFGGRYTVSREIGRGATATVYLAEDNVEHRSVAIKVLRPELTQSRAADLFLREIRFTSTLAHPRILPVLDAGQQSGRLYYVLPYMSEGTLRQRLTRERQLPISDAVAIARSIAEALEQAHRQGLVHRDIKPENVLFADGAAYLADFGIARALETSMDETSTSAGIVRGTVAYMSPEQASGSRDIDGRSDVFSLGCVLYEMLAGVPAFIGPTPEVILAQRFAHRPRDIAVYRPSVPASVDAVVKKAMANAPADRYRGAGEFAAALRAIESGANLGAPASVTTADAPITRDLTLSGVRRWLRANPWLLTGAVVLAAVAVTFLYRAVTGRRIALGERDWVLVADFEGPSEDKALPTAVRELVTTELNQSRSIGTVTRQQLNSVMRLAGVAETTHVDAELARQLAVRTSVRAIVAGSIQQIAENRYSLALHVVSADSGPGRNLYSVATTSTEENLVSEIGGLARDLRRRLGEQPEAIASSLPLMEAATPSFRAYQKYLDGIMQAQRGDVGRSNAAFQEALTLDSSFASAFAAIAANYITARKIDSAQLNLEKALRIPGRLTNAQKYRLQADIAYAIEHDIPAAARWYDLYVAEVPRAIGGRNNRALYLSAVGKYEEAVADLRAAIAANPFGPELVQINLFNLAAMLATLGRVDEAQTATHDLKPPFLAGAQLLIAAARGDWTAVESIARVVDTTKASPVLISILARTGRAAARASRGSFASADAELRAARDSSSGSVARWYDRCVLLLSLASNRLLLPNVSSSADTTPAAALGRALRAAITRDTARALVELSRVESAPAPVRALLGPGPTLVRGWIAVARNRWSEVTDSLSALSLAGQHDATVLDQPSSLEIRWLVANAYAAQGKLDSAIAHMERATSSLRVPAGHLTMSGLVLPAAHDRLATWSLDRGDRVAATNHWRQVLALLKQADPEATPLLVRARAGLETHGRTP